MHSIIVVIFKSKSRKIVKQHQQKNKKKNKKFFENTHQPNRKVIKIREKERKALTAYIPISSNNKNHRKSEVEVMKCGTFSVLTVDILM